MLYSLLSGRISGPATMRATSWPSTPFVCSQQKNSMVVDVTGDRQGQGRGDWICAPCHQSKDAATQFCHASVFQPRTAESRPGPYGAWTLWKHGGVSEGFCAGCSATAGCHIFAGSPWLQPSSDTKIEYLCIIKVIHLVFCRQKKVVAIACWLVKNCTTLVITFVVHI